MLADQTLATVICLVSFKSYLLIPDKIIDKFLFTITHEDFEALFHGLDEFHGQLNSRAVVRTLRSCAYQVVSWSFLLI